MNNSIKINNLSSIEELSDEQVMNIFGGRGITATASVTARVPRLAGPFNPFDSLNPFNPTPTGTPIKIGPVFRFRR